MKRVYFFAGILAALVLPTSNLSAQYNWGVPDASGIDHGQSLTKHISKVEKVLFRQNEGQWADDILYQGYTPNANVNFLKNAISFGFVRQYENVEDPRIEETELMVWNLELEGAKIDATMSASGARQSVTNYLLGDDPSKYVKNATDYSEVRYQQVYDGIDLRYYSNGEDLKYDFILKPGADVNDIKLKAVGIEGLLINRKGEMEITTPWGILVENKPYSYQLVDGVEKEIDIRFELLSDKSFGFKVYGKYDKSKELIIDPVILKWGSFSGGTDSSTGGYIFGNTMDKDGNVYGTGKYVRTFPTTAGVYNINNSGGQDIYVVKLSADGSQQMYSTYVGGSSNDIAYGVEVNDAGEAHIVGKSRSNNFPRKSAHDNSFNGGNIDGDIVVFKLTADGTGLVYSTYLGGTSQDYGDGISLDAAGNAYVVGVTRSHDFDVSAGAYQPAFGGGPKDEKDASHKDYVFAKFSPTGNRIFSSYLGGDKTEGSAAGLRRSFTGIKATDNGEFYITGNSNSTNFPITTGAYLASSGGTWYGAFVSKFNAAGNALVYSTFIGPGRGTGIDVNAAGEAFVVGSTGQAFPVTNGAYQTNFVGGPASSALLEGRDDAFVCRLNASGTGVIYATHLGWSRDDQGVGIAVSSKNEAYIGIFSTSDDVDVDNCSFQQSHGSPGGSPDFVLAKLNAQGTDLLYSSYVGGRRNDYYAADISIREIDGCVCEITSSITSHSDDFPTTAGAFQPTKINGGTDQPTLNKFKPEIDIQFTTSTPACNTPILFTDNSNWSCLWHDAGWTPDYYWDFGDGTTSTQKNPTHTYAVTGTFQVKHKVSKCDSLIQTIVIPGPVDIDLGPDFGQCSGQISELLDAGIHAGATYRWQDGSTGSTFNATAPGIYYVDVTIGSCVVSDTVEIELGQMTATAAGTDLTCGGGSNGTANATVNGGGAPYNYSWSPSGQNGQSVSGLSAGTHTVTITDKDNCQTTATVTITEPQTLTASVTKVDAGCSGNDGSATAQLTGGTAPYSNISWSSGHTNTIATGLAPGTYTFTANDAAGCTVTETVIISQNQSNITGTITFKQDGDCQGGSGMATVTPGGGAGPYTYQWNDPSNQTTRTATNLPAGTYNVTITDKNGCVGSTTVTIDASGDLEIVPGPIEPDGCDRFGGHSGTASVIINNGTPPYTYQWDDKQQQTTATAIGLNLGTYTVVVSDAGGCSSSIQVEIVEKIQISTNIDANPTCSGCTDGQLTANVTGTGTPPLTYRWDDADEQTTATATGLPSGTYVVLVTDAQGCFNSDTITISSPDGVEDPWVDLSGSVNVYPNPNSGVFTIDLPQELNDDPVVRVYDVRGRTVYKSDYLNQSRLDLSMVENGLYLVEIVSENNRAVRKIRITRD